VEHGCGSFFGSVKEKSNHSGSPSQFPRQLKKPRGFLMKIKISGFDEEIVSTLFIWCDECRRPRRGTPTADQYLFKNSPARRASQRP
jgi:hypothetical protein